MSIPHIPPRPTRTHQQQHIGATGVEAPMIPPRPEHSSQDRSQSPNRDTLAKSTHASMSRGIYGSNSPDISSSSLHLPNRPPSVSLPSIGQEGNEYADIDYDSPQVPSVDPTDQSLPTQTRIVGSDLPLHAPKPSFSKSTAKARVANVTRTDSSQAAAIGIGKAITPGPNDDQDSQHRILHPQTSFTKNRPDSSASTERPSSTQPSDGGHGIPEIGQRVPMYPDAGDVQAPSPSPFSQNFSSSTGVNNDGTQKVGRQRTRSGRESFHGPPGSYGMHGHGVPNHDRFQKAWYDKHPDALEREEHGQYGPGISGGRGEWAMSSDDLNKLVSETARRASGFGTSPNVVGLPNEQIGYLASEEYASRMNSPRPQSGIYHNKSHSNHSQTHVASPLRKASFPIDIDAQPDFNKSKDTHSTSRYSSDNALESETEDDDVIHVNAPASQTSKYAGNGYDPPTEDLGPHGGNTENEGGWIEERGYGVPILASDEVAKTPGMEFMQPAVPPVQESKGGIYYAGVDSDAPPSYQSGYRNSSSRTSSISGSRPSSRPGSIHGSLPGLARYISLDEREDAHTPLEDVDEYEPLFSEEPDKQERALSGTDRFNKRPSEMKRRFPSQDIWEDTPNSLQLQATVTTPEPSQEVTLLPKQSSAFFESPETEATRKGEVGEDEKAKLIPKEERWAKSNFKPHVREDVRRPTLKQRFPSRDIWEDSPDSARLETTVGGPQGDDPRSSPDEGLLAGAVVQTSGRPDAEKVRGEHAHDGQTDGASALGKPGIPPRPMKSKLSRESHGPSPEPPSIPARPFQKLRQAPLADVPSSQLKTPGEIQPSEAKSVSPTEARRAPGLPDRPKPQVPARPAKPVPCDSIDTIPLSKTTSMNSTGSAGTGDESASTKSVSFTPPAPKPKPALPARSVGGKIASLKAGFMSDLDKRLQLGPQATPKPQEKAVDLDQKDDEKAPLVDARKGRARGPARRKPASASPVVAENQSKAEKSKWEIREPRSVWYTEDDGSLYVLSTTPAALQEPEPPSKALEAPAPTLGTNMAGEPVCAPVDIPREAEQAPLVDDEAVFAHETGDSKEDIVSSDKSSVVPKSAIASSSEEDKEELTPSTSDGGEAVPESVKPDPSAVVGDSVAGLEMEDNEGAKVVGRKGFGEQEPMAGKEAGGMIRGEMVE